jgi:hypothetical protein
MISSLATLSASALQPAEPEPPAASGTSPSAPPRWAAAAPGHLPRAGNTRDAPKGWTNTLDLLPILQGLHALQDLPVDDPARIDQCEAFADQIARCSAAYLVPDSGTRDLIQATRASMAQEVLNPVSRSASRPVGVQNVLDLFLPRWEETLTTYEARRETLLVAKPAVLSAPLLVASAVGTGTWLGELPPRPGILLGATIEDIPLGDALGHPLLALRNSPWGLHIAVPPQLPAGDAKLDTERALDDLQMELFEAVGGASLATAVDNYNQKAYPPLRLVLRPDVPRELTNAVVQPYAVNVIEQEIWFTYELLAEDSVLDEQIADDDHLVSILKNARVLAQSMEQNATPGKVLRRLPAGEIYRPMLLRGCAVQLMLERLLGERAGDRTATFGVPLGHVETLMSATERSVWADMKQKREMWSAGNGEGRAAAAAATQMQGSYVERSTGQPMGSLLLREMTDHFLDDDDEEDVYRDIDIHAGDHCVPDISQPSRPAKVPRQADPVQRKDVSRDLHPTQQWWYQALMAYKQVKQGTLHFDNLKPFRLQPSWLKNTVNPAHAPDVTAPVEFEPQDTQAPGAEHLMTPFAANFDREMRTILEQIREPGSWASFSAELPPRFITACPGWPAGRPLHIHHVDNGAQLFCSELAGKDRPPVVVALDLKNSHYQGVSEGTLLENDLDGNCFYAAVLASLPKEEREALLSACGVQHVETCFLPEATAALRHHFANHLALNMEAYRDRILQLHLEVGS